MEYVFPAVFYKDEENDRYIVAFDDVEVYCQGRTVEEAFVVAKRYLEEFCRLSMKMFGEVQEKPRDYLESREIHKNEIVMLVDAMIEEKNPKNIIDKIATNIKKPNKPEVKLDLE